MSKHGILATTEPIYRVSASSFLKAVRRGQLANKNGWMVDAYSKKEYKGMKTYLTRDGKAGMAIKKDGNVVSLFATVGGKNSMGKLIPFAVAHGGRKLDAFAVKGDRNLANMYGRYGARATGKMAFDPEYAPNLWKMKSADFRNDPTNSPDVVAMTLPSSLSSLIRKYNKDYRVDLSKVKEYSDYYKMLSDRDRSVGAASLRAALGGGR